MVRCPVMKAVCCCLWWRQCLKCTRVLWLSSGESWCLLYVLLFACWVPVAVATQCCSHFSVGLLAGLAAWYYSP
jgi:hypothetical protein